MKLISALSILVLLLSACKKDAAPSDLERFEIENEGLNKHFLIACAGGNMTSFMNNFVEPISIFYYNIDGVSEASIYLKSKEGSENEYANYSEISLNKESLFNNRMGKFTANSSFDNAWVIVAYTTDTSYHISDPILLRASSTPTVNIDQNIQYTDVFGNPYFDWSSDNTEGNVIHFSLIADAEDNFLSGVYTTDQWWQFYDLSNVVLNVTPTLNPTLNTGAHSYINMGVDEENWVRTFGSINF